MARSEGTAEQHSNDDISTPLLTDKLLRWILWLVFDWSPSDIKKKAALSLATIWLLDTLFFTHLIGTLILGILLLIIGLISLIPYAPTAIGIADKLDLINLTQEQAIIRRFFSLLFTDLPEYSELLLDYLFRD